MSCNQFSQKSYFFFWQYTKSNSLCYLRKNPFSSVGWSSLLFDLTVSSIYFVYTCHLSADLIVLHGFLSLFRISMENNFRASPVVPKQEQLDSPSLLVRAHLRILLVWTAGLNRRLIHPLQSVRFRLRKGLWRILSAFTAVLRLWKTSPKKNIGYHWLVPINASVFPQIFCFPPSGSSCKLTVDSCTFTSLVYMK